ncbi:MAG: hypothetical protein LQ343_004908 [Gyalolechia ehrenbergii]|nr:MAG: hypothetical protein LQ343_004908 [Gyalolechia ehrenbergii]
MSTFILPNSEPEVPINLTSDLYPDQLLSFPAFKTWIETLQQSLATQAYESHIFYDDPYRLRKIDVQSVDFFGGKRLGFVKLQAEVSNERGEKLPGSVFLRGGSVGMMLILQPDDVPEQSEEDKQVILTFQPRIPAGSLSFPELPAGMLDDSGSFAGGAAKEIVEETGLEIPASDLTNMTKLGIPAGPSDSDEHLQQAVYPSPGGCDEFIPIFLWQKRVPRGQLKEWQGKLTEPLMIKDARWTKLVLTTYKDPLGKQRTWEHAERATRPKDSPIDGVGIVAILQKASGPELLLQKQFRPPVNKAVVEIPAGLVDAGESAAESAVRELREETGYHGEVSEVSPVMFNDPGFCNTNLNMVHVNVDMNLPENQNLKPELEDNEFIEVFSLPLRNLYAECKKLEDEGYAIDARVGTLAEGIELARRWRL